MRGTPLLLLVLVWLVTGCNAPGYTGISSVFTQEEAIAKVDKLLGTAFPDKPSTVIGRIGVGGPAPWRTIPATLQTKVEQDGPQSYTVTLTEWWNAKDAGGGSVSRRLKHYWTYKVNPAAAALVAEGGDLPPQAFR